MTWTMVDEDGHVWGTVVDGDLVRVELSRLSSPIGGAGVQALEAALDAVVALRRELGGHCVKQISIGAPGFGFDELGLASDLPITINGPARA